MKLTKTLVSAILGGVAISLSSLAYIVVRNSSLLLASLMFAAGFLAVVIFNFDIFTDGIGSLFDNGSATHNFKKFGITLLGNVLGALATGALTQLNMTQTGASSLAKALHAENYNNVDFSFFISAIIGGMLIFLALHGYRKAGGGFASCAILIFTTALLPISNFEYTIFNTFLITACNDTVSKYVDQSFTCFFIIVISAVGNALGAMILSVLYKYKEKEVDATHGRAAVEREKKKREKEREKERKKRSKKSDERHHHHHSSSYSEKDYREFEEFKRFKRELERHAAKENSENAAEPEQTQAAEESEE